MRVQGAILSLVMSVSAGDPGAARACGVSGTTEAAVVGRIKDLSEILAGLESAIADAEAAERDERFYERALVVAKLTVATCDLFFEVVAQSSMAGKVIKAVYKQKDTLADASVGKFDAAKATNRMTKGASEFMPAGGKVVTGVVTSTTDVLIDGVRGNLTAKKVAMEASKRNLDLLAEALKAEGKSRAVAVIKSGKAVFTAGAAVFDAFNGASSESGIASAKKALLRQSKDVRDKIKQLNEELKACPEITLP
jgi:hypothetical protein